MRVVVTGGAGYIGSILSEELLAADHEVAVYDNLSRGHRDAIPAAAQFRRGDLLDTEHVLELLREWDAQAVIHAAGLIAVGESVLHPDLYYRANLEGGLHLLDAVVEAGVPYFVFSSTAAVYGEAHEAALRESDPTEPSNPYGATKLAFEHALKWYGKAFGVQHVSLRYFNAAGATRSRGERHDPETHLIPRLLSVADGTESRLTVFGDDYPTPDGSCIRDYVHVVDLARAHLCALEALRTRPDRVSPVFNVGYGTGHSVLQVVEAVRRVTGHPVPVQIGPRRPGDPPRLIACPERIRSELGWVPDHGELETIVESAWRWMREHSHPERAVHG